MCRKFITKGKKLPNIQNDKHFQWGKNAASVLKNENLPKKNLDGSDFSGAKVAKQNAVRRFLYFLVFSSIF